MTARVRAVSLGLVLAAVVLAPAVYGQDPSAEEVAAAAERQATAFGEVLQGLETRIGRTVQAWVAPMQEIARALLFGLVLLALVWRFIEATLRNADFGEIVLELVRTIMYAGFFLVVIENSPTWAYAVVESFRQAAGQAQSAAMARMGTPLVLGPTTPADVVSEGVRFVAVLLDEAVWYKWVVIAILGGVIVLMFAAIAAYMLLVTAEMYIVTAAGVLLLGFGGSPWTEDFAKRYLVYTVSVGAKLFTLLLVVGFALGIFATWEAASGPDAESSTSIVMALAIVFVSLMLVTMLPGMVQGIINGSSIGSGGPALTGMMTGVMTAVTSGVTKAARAAVGGAAAAKGTAAAMGAGSLGEAVRMDGGGAKGAAKFAGRTAWSAAKAGAAVAVGMGSGSVLEELQGRRAAAEAARAGDPVQAGLDTLMERLGGGGSIKPGGDE